MPNQREQILQAAAAEFAEVGFSKAGLKTIADKAGLQVQVVRALYVDKETLLNELMLHETEPLVNAMALAVENIDNPRELVEAFLKMFDQWMFDHEQLIKVWMRCALESAETLNLLLQKSLMPSDFFARLQQLIDAGQIRCKNLFILSLLFDSLMVFPHMMRPTMELVYPEGTVTQLFEQRFSAVIDLLEHGLYSGPDASDQ